MTDTAHGPARPGDLVEAAGEPVGGGLIKDSYDPRLTNDDLAPLKNYYLGDPEAAKKAAEAVANQAK